MGTSLKGTDLHVADVNTDIACTASMGHKFFVDTGDARFVACIHCGTVVYVGEWKRTT